MMHNRCFKIVTGEKSSNILKTVTLSSDTASMRIHEMSTEIANEVIEHIKSGGCDALKLDETMDIARCAVLFAVTCYIGNNSTED